MLRLKAHIRGEVAAMSIHDQGPVCWFDDVVLKRNPHRAPLIKDVLENGYTVTSEMLWGKNLSDEEISKKRHDLLERAIKQFGVSGERARAALKDFESM
jgi:hypothetical protein